MVLPSWQLSTKQPLTHSLTPHPAQGDGEENQERKVKLNCGTRWINNQNKVKYEKTIKMIIILIIIVIKRKGREREKSKKSKAYNPKKGQISQKQKLQIE